MTKTTTGSSRLTVILSWMIALICFVGGALYIWKMPSPDQEAMDLQMKQQKNQKSRKSLTEKVKQEQAQRALPANYARQLVEQSEVLVKKNLEEQVKKFQTMAETMRRRKDDMLAKVEKRKLPWGAPADANDTSKARAIPQAGNPSANASVEELYAVLRDYEAEIQQSHLAVSAAKQSLSKGQSFPEVYSSLKAGNSRMPSFDELIRMQSRDGEWATSAGSNASGGLEIKSTADLNNYRGLLGQATRQAGLAQSRLEGLFGAVRQAGNPGNGMGQGNGSSGNGGSGGNGSGNGNGTGMRIQFKEKFEEIKVEFDKVFKELFGGGRGTIELVEGEDILEAGIVIISQPPGKKLQNMMQLSGGEKALTAIALLFAIQNLKPSPFCLLDEIEAALDDSNVGRYANYLHKLTKHTQFIVITHRRGTMAAADRLYGITMQEKGVSALVSVDLIANDLDKKKE